MKTTAIDLEFVPSYAFSNVPGLMWLVDTIHAQRLEGIKTAASRRLVSCLFFVYIVCKIRRFTMVPEIKKNQEALDWVDDNWDELDDLADSFGVSIIAREPGPGYDFKHDGESLALKAGVSAPALRLAFVEAVKGKRPDAVLALLETRDDDLPPGAIL